MVLMLNFVPLQAPINHPPLLHPGTLTDRGDAVGLSIMFQV